MSYRIAVDTGGTFTDVVVADAQGHLVVGKALTTPERTYDGFSAALANAAEIIGVPVETLLGETEVLIYGTTRSTNSIVEKKTAKTALLLTEGFPDILLYRQGGKREPLDLEVSHHVVQALTLCAEKVGRRDFAVVEDELRHRACTHSHLGDVSRTGKAWAVPVHDES